MEGNEVLRGFKAGGCGLVVFVSIGGRVSELWRLTSGPASRPLLIGGGEEGVEMTEPRAGGGLDGFFTSDARGDFEAAFDELAGTRGMDDTGADALGEVGRAEGDGEGLMSLCEADGAKDRVM
jgi:hypothetical protein